MVIENMENPEIITIQLEDNRSVACRIISVFPVLSLNGMFIALNPIEDTGFGSIDEIHLFSLVPLDNNQYELAVIDNSVFNTVLDEFYRLMET